MAYQDIYEVVLYQQYYSQVVLNVFFYQDTSPTSTGAASDLASSFLINVSPRIRDLQTTAVRQTRIVVRNLFNPADRIDNPISVMGARTNLDSLPSFVAVGYTLGHNNGSIRPGSKRFAGLDESDISNGVITNPSLPSLLNSLAIAIIQNLIVTGITTFTPIVVKRILTTAGDYRLPSSLAELVAGIITSAIWKALVTSQVSRKIGVGI